MYPFHVSPYQAAVLLTALKLLEVEMEDAIFRDGYIDDALHTNNYLTCIEMCEEAKALKLHLCQLIAKK